MGNLYSKINPQVLTEDVSDYPNTPVTNVSKKVKFKILLKINLKFNV